MHRVMSCIEELVVEPHNDTVLDFGDRQLLDCDETYLQPFMVPLLNNLMTNFYVMAIK